MANRFKLINRLVNALAAFKEGQLITDPFDESAHLFEDIENRRTRYNILWAFYENTAYRDIHKWAQKFRADMGLYKYVRNIYSPANRLGTFWQTHLYGGALDLDVSSNLDTALPIEEIGEGNLDAIQKGLASVWRWSNWAKNKDLYTLYGTVLGDVGIKIVDDSDHSRIRFEVIHPSAIKDVDRDTFGFVKAYHLEESRIWTNPNGEDEVVVFEEIVTKNQDTITFKTLKDGKPFAWNGVDSSWTKEYGVTPFIATQHIDVGLNWGWSEMHAARPQIQELDDIASQLHDQIRKMVNPMWLFSGVRKPKTDAVFAESTATTARPEQLREEFPVLFGSEKASAKPLIANLDIRAVLETIRMLMDKVEDAFPELKMELFDAPGEISGRALRLKRQPVETKGEIRQATYNADMVRANQIALTLGGIAGYPEFTGISINSFKKGALDHKIIQKRMFSTDPLDDLEMEREFWLTAKMAGSAGIPIDTFLETQEFKTKEKIEEFTSNEAYKKLRKQEDDLFEFDLTIPVTTGDESAENELRNT